MLNDYMEMLKNSSDVSKYIDKKLLSFFKDEFPKEFFINRILPQIIK